jgi:hypothetical protein
VLYSLISELYMRARDIFLSSQSPGYAGDYCHITEGCVIMTKPYVSSDECRVTESSTGKRALRQAVYNSHRTKE